LQIHHDNPEFHPNLNGRKTNTGGVVHRLQHVIHELAMLIGNPAFNGQGHIFKTRIGNGENI